ncbi:MAG: hypothetical protein CNLJKLNK_00370 [Holosporales bacterium]
MKLFFTLLAFVLSHITLDAATNYPAAINKVLKESKEKKEIAIQKIAAAKRIHENWEDVKKQAFIVDNAGKVAVLAVVEFLCPHCHDFLTGIKDVKFKESKVDLIVLSLPVFRSDLSAEYGSLATAAYRLAPLKIMDILTQYAFRDIDTFKNQLQKDFNLKIATESIQNADYSKNETLLDKLNIPRVPMPFIVMNRKEKGHLVIPLPNYNAVEIFKIAKEAENMNDETFSNLKKDLDQ